MTGCSASVCARACVCAQLPAAMLSERDGESVITRRNNITARPGSVHCAAASAHRTST